MSAAPDQAFSEDDFKRSLQTLLGGVPAKMWLARSNGHRLDTLFSVGEAQSTPIKLIARHNGYYLLGENVPDALAPRAQALLQAFCQTHAAEDFRTHHGHAGHHHAVHHRRPLQSTRLPNLGYYS